MKILLINKYFYRKGGAETIFFDTAKLLQEKGHEVQFFSMHHSDNQPSAYSSYFLSNVDYEDHSLKSILRSSGRILYSLEAQRKIDRLLDKYQPDIVHAHNIYHQISPSILPVIKKRGIPIVLTLHDYKLICGSHNLMSNSMVCESCRGGRYYNCFVQRCVKKSRLKSLLCTIEMYLHHNGLHSYDFVDCFISPSRFLKNKVREMGGRARIEWIFNFIDLDLFQPDSQWQENSIVYFGRLSEVKGLPTLVKAMRGSGIKLKIIGDGPVKGAIQRMLVQERIENVSLLGFKNGKELHNEIRKSMAVIVPSEWYENNPMSVIEAFALGKPVIGSRIGGIPELVKDYETGLTFLTGDPEDLKAKINWFAEHQDHVVDMGRRARKLATQEFGSDTHYRRLMNLYQSLLKSNGTNRR